MRIGIYNPRAGFSRSGGTETFLREMMKRLQDDHEVVLYCGAGDLLEEVRDLSVTVRQVPLLKKESRLNNAIASRTPVLPAEIESLSMYANARREGIFGEMNTDVDVLSTHYYLDNLLVSRTAPIPTLFRFPGIKQPSIRWKTMARLATPDAYLSNSEATAARLREWLGLEVDGTVHAGVDLEQFGPEADPAFKCDRASVLFVGRLDEGKGLFDLLKAQSQLGDATRLYLVGSGTLEDDLRESADTLGIADDVEFVGAVPHDEIHRYYAAADIFCLPSYHEGFPIVNMEALASGCALVSTQIDSIEEQVTDGETGLLVAPGDVDALANALRRVATDRDMRQRLVENGLERAEAFGWAEQAEKMSEYYECVR